MGTAESRATFGETKRELNVSTYQMCILLLFNERDRVSYRDIISETGIPAEDLKRSLQSLALVKGRNVLRKEPMSKEVNDDDVFVFNERFTSKLLKVKIGTVSASRESEPEKRETRMRIEDDRKPQIEAAIVRVMKARRQLDHNGVVQEVTKQLSSRFIPNPVDIKKHLENLIEREFIERDRNDRKLTSTSRELGERVGDERERGDESRVASKTIRRLREQYGTSSTLTCASRSLEASARDTACFACTLGT